MVLVNKFISLCFTLLFFTGCSKGPLPNSKEKVLLVGTNAEFAPFSFIQDGEIQGFEIDVAKELCARIGVKIQVIDLPFDGLIPELQMQKVHFIAAGMTITPEREKVVEFTDPYLEGSPLCLVYLKAKFDDHPLLELKNLKVVVNDGYTADFYASDILKLTPIRLSNPVDAMIALKSNRAEVFITAKDTLSPLLENKIYSDFSYQPIEGTEENCASMLPKGSLELKSQLNHSLKMMKRDGTLDALKSKWGLL
jgi:arginine/lysine/histidine transporter system substrate-binding protein